MKARLSIDSPDSGRLCSAQSTQPSREPLMAKKGKLQKNDRRAELVARYAEKRARLVAVIKDPAASPNEKRQAMSTLQALPRDSAAVRYRNRCQMSGRPRGFIGKFGISRIAFREMSLDGLIPGVRKSSW